MRKAKILPRAPQVRKYLLVVGKRSRDIPLRKRRIILSAPLISDQNFLVRTIVTLFIFRSKSVEGVRLGGDLESRV